MMNQKSETPGRQGQGSQIERSSHASQNLSENSAPVNPVARVLDLHAINSFLGTIASDGRGVTFQTFDDSKKRRDGSLARIEHGSVTDHIDYFNRAAERGAGIFFCTALTDGKGRCKGNVVGFRVFWVDLDGAPLEPVLSWRLKPTIVTETSPDRFQVFWVLEDVVPIEQCSLDRYSDIQSKLATLFGGDPSVADPSHVARLPGSWHQKNPDAPFKVCVVQPNTWDCYDVADFERELEGVVPANRASSPTQGWAGSNSKKTGGDAAPSKEAALACLRNIRNDVGTRFDGRNKFVGLVAGIEVMCADLRDDPEIDDAIWEVYLAYPGNDHEYVQHILGSNLDKDRGYRWVMEITGQGSALAQMDFAKPPDIADEDLPEAPEEVALAAAEARYVYCLDLEAFADLETGSFLKATAFRIQNTHIAPAGSFGLKSADNKLFNRKTFRRVATASYRPGEPPLTRQMANGAMQEVVNTWRPSPLVPIRGVHPTPWLDHVHKLLSDPGEREHFLNWCAYVLQNPGKKINHAIVLYSATQGVGKDTALAPLIYGVGEHNKKGASPAALTQPYTPFLEGQLIVVSEMENFEKRDVYNKLKEWLADPPSTVDVRHMYIRPYPVPNIQNWAFNTNKENAIAMEQTDRRFWIANCDIPRPPEDYFIGLWNWLKSKQEKGLEKCVGWLLDRNVSAFNPKAPPPDTRAKKAMLDHSQPAPIRWCCGQLREDGEFEDRTVMSASDLVRASARSKNSGARDVSDKGAVAALKAEGFRKVPQKRNGKGFLRLWVRGKKADLLLQLAASNPKAFVAKYHEEGGSDGHVWEGDSEVAV
jgi:hypothetical protein